MPAVTITNDGATPVIPADQTRTGLILENNSNRDMRIRFSGPVSLAAQNQKGLKLRAGGGAKALAGTHARTAVYCIYEQTPDAAIEMDYETLTS
jgi:hypothetical protein